ncbi:MAG: MipA/OmpV family protein [Alphaproteobacteria bacterium]|nr:MipA/OmpV family protein [Alphaproteobacteria bacterium]MCB9931396.1 MipA/OmpV family protein [Alphaproteobacteria bacterium]
MRTTAISAVFSAIACAMGGAAVAADGFITIAPGNIPNFFAIGIGAAPDYLGSDNYMAGGAPAGRVAIGEHRYVSLEANYLSVNLINDPHFQAGPSGLYRFGRDNVDDRLVDKLPDIDNTVELGAFVGYEWWDEDDSRNRWRIGADFLHDVGGVHNGFVVSASLRKWFAIGSTGALGIGLATSYGSDDYTDKYFSVTSRGAAASGLHMFQADGGMRDARLTALYVQPISQSWIVGAGAMYSRFLGDAADSPVVDDRGDANQFIFGVGAGYTW